MSNQRIVLAGGSGFLGQALAARFVSANYDVAVLSRSPQRQADHRRVGIFQPWDGATLGPWADLLDGAAAVINLTGKSINCRPTAGNRKAILESRVKSVAVLAHAVRKCKRPPEVIVQTSAVGFYGDRGDEICDEASPPGQGLLASTCMAWEQAFNDEVMPGVRRVLFRLGVVLGNKGGALPMLAMLTRCLLGGAAGSGGQYVSWLHIADAEALFLRAIEQAGMQGVYVASSPDPITNASLMQALRHALHRPWSPPAPAMAVRLGGWLIGINAELVLASQRCRPTHLLAEGFEFAYPEIGWAVGNLLAE